MRPLTDAEMRLIQALDTPEKVQHYLYEIPYNHEKEGETIYSFRQVVEKNTAHCLEGALFAAAILEHHGYPPLLLDMESTDGIDHVLFLFQENGKHGTVGVSRDIGLHGRRPLFSDLESLVSSYYDPYLNQEAEITGYAKADLRDLGNYDWRFSPRNLHKVEKYLIDFPHLPFRPPRERYHRELSRYHSFMEKYMENDEFPIDYFKNRQEWWRQDK
jgi:hypothetical protein